ncbi:conserved hypothetical protein [uncultured Paludibacter sp.]|uniref:DNA mimic protein DMP19 C-terminal domain-containing protein n=1 Tax=uncultured Paludibacter sp. TaxID=497635 RepID=A0A653AJG6_9BACT|nr:conserved hypothetical protein [uncultured Paludibacter sp.]
MINQTRISSSMKISKPIILFFILMNIFSFLNCTTKNQHKIGTYKEVKNTLKESKQPEKTPVGDIEELEGEVNNGGFNQYFFNSSGQNCFATLKLLKEKKKYKTAKLLEEAINLINPNHLSEEELIKKIRNREVEELDDDTISEKLNKLDELFYKNPDGI